MLQFYAENFCLSKYMNPVLAQLLKSKLAVWQSQLEEDHVGVDPKDTAL